MKLKKVKKYYLQSLLSLKKLKLNYRLLWAILLKIKPFISIIWVILTIIFVLISLRLALWPSFYIWRTQHQLEQQLKLKYAKRYQLYVKQAKWQLALTQRRNNYRSHLYVLQQKLPTERLIQFILETLKYFDLRVQSFQSLERSLCTVVCQQSYLLKLYGSYQETMRWLSTISQSPLLFWLSKLNLTATNYKNNLIKVEVILNVAYKK